jgi:hypothetical protein
MKKSVLLIPLAILLVGGALGLTMLNRPAGYASSEADPIALAVHPGGQLPYVITAGGQLLEADSNNRWQPIGPQARVKDVLYASTGHLWAATDLGLYLQQGNDTWQLVDNTPGRTLESTHGYLFSIGPDAIVRLTESKDPKLDSLRALTLPASPASDLVMLGSHTHVLHTGDQVFHTLDVGLSWRPLDAPEPVHSVWTDADGSLIAATDAHVLRWNGSQWAAFLPLPDGQPIDEMRVYNDRVYALAAGTLYGQSAANWQKIELPDSLNASFAAVEFEYPDTLWLLDSSGKRLYTTTDGQNWTTIPIQTA